MSTMGKHDVVELEFEADESELNSYASLSLDVTFRSPSGRLLRVAGFWYEAHRWMVRFAPDEIGQWSWLSESNDQSLRARLGDFEVSNAVGENPWRIHGPLSIHSSGRSFAHADGTPAFWLADTVWAAPAHATIEEWREYVAYRSRQGFNVLQINALPQWDASGPPIRLPFAKADGHDDLTRPDLDYFKFLDEVVRTAADAGLISAMVVLWFENTPADNENWTVKVPRRGPFTQETARLFARFLTARYEAFGVTWIISGDSSFAAQASLSLYDVAAKTIRETAARPPIMTAHLNGSTPPPVALNARGWMDYHMFQSCHFRDSAARARQYAAEARAFLPSRPVLNGEPCYDSLRQMDQSNSTDQRFDRVDVRRASWVSVLSGANAGLTYGAHGTWPWHRDGQDYGPIHYGMPLDWRRALVLESADDVARLKQFFSRLPWWEIEPASGIVAEAAESLLATARTSRDRYVFAYITNPTRLQLPAALAVGRSGAWFDPATGSWSDARIEETQEGWFVEPGKADGEAVLELQLKRSSGARIDGLDHIALVTGNISTSISFYTNVLGFTLTYRKTLEHRNLDYAFLELGSCRLEILQPLAGFKGTLTPALNHFALAVEGLETFVERFRDEGIIFDEPAITDLPELFSRGARGSFLSGPDGERIELFERLK